MAADRTERDILRGKEAEQILGHALVKEAFATVESDLCAAWLGSPEADSAGRERAYRMVWSFRAFRRFFEGVVENGAMAEATLAELLKSDKPFAYSARAPENEHFNSEPPMPGAPL